MNNIEFFKFLTNEPSILEKKYGKISSFNFFRRNVGYSHDWTHEVEVARGLYINNETCEIVGRSYNKWYAINEKPETKMDNLKETLSFPLEAYIKYNGYLAILGYDSQSDELVFTSKASIGGECALIFERIFRETVEDTVSVKKFLKDMNVSMVFEVISPTKQPHIIEYEQEHIVLLDIVYREPNYKKYTYFNLTMIGEFFKMQYKKLAYTLNTWEEFYDWYKLIMKEDYLYEGAKIEGFVIEDSKGYMVKVKLTDYLFWKKMRRLRDTTRKYGDVTDYINLPRANMFYHWLIEQDTSYLKKDIITLRNLFQKEYKQVKLTCLKSNTWDSCFTLYDYCIDEKGVYGIVEDNVYYLSEIALAGYKVTIL
ncbi:T4 RnlA family RNA ligase [Clostridium tagluense]|uniref:T4 RNA ligase 1-like N-terminal domain-containing protein n=1 Tax=Clostridium tagluense TaxID=360422 RepID=A0A401UTK2_9CLOT|nr:T4 RnlA family RNA ligase [Clostridium tagluense]GCD12889.1 hypothetical protein Ctaglu_45120 [Clostridium tagluense]